MKKIFAIDLDGTLFYPMHPLKLLNKKTVQNIKKIEQNGDYFVAVTGRNFLSSINVSKKAGVNPYIVGCNGAFVYANGEYLYQNTLDESVIRRLINFVTSKYKNLTISVMSKDGTLYFDKTTTPLHRRIFYSIYCLFIGKLANVYKNSKVKFDEVIKNNDVYKLMVVFGISLGAKKRAKAVNKEIFANFKDEIETSWSNQVIEITCKNTTKSSSILKLADFLGVKKEDVIVMGDSGNDIDMFKEFYENSYCVKRANRSVKKYAKNIVKNFNKIDYLIK